MEQPDYEPRYLAGVRLFNDREFFECHEVFECLWNECPAGERRFYQGLLQAAVALYHFGNGNLRGALRLFHSGKTYMERYPSPYLGLDRAAFWEAMTRCFTPIFTETDLMRRDLRPERSAIPTVTLDPPPIAWPDPNDFLPDDE